MPCGASTMPIHASSSCTNTFTDRHIHGIAGVDFATSGEGAIRAAVELLASRRTTGLIASLPALRLETLEPALDRLAGLHAAGVIAGVHLEGPFLAPEFAGAHPLEALLSPSSSVGRHLLEAILQRQTDTRCITMMTLAPELPGFADTVALLVNAGIEPALGHTAATYSEMRRGIELVFDQTARPVVITHCYNAMRGFHHRDPGPLLAVIEAVERGEVLVEFIADGHHVDLEVLRWWFQRWPRAIRLVSDASAATLPGDGPPLVHGAPRLGHISLANSDKHGPRLADETTLASGGKDLLAIHDDLVSAGFQHDDVCAAMRR